MTWQPWIDYKDTPPPALPIKEPPCKDCEFWRPHADFNKDGSFDGITCCVADEQYNDFSCYREVR